MAASGLHISISAEPIAHVGGLVISNSIFTSLIVSVLLIALALIVRSQIKPTGKPRGLQNAFEMIIEMFYGLVYGVTGSRKKTMHFLPIILTFFLFILFNNWIGLIPGSGTIGFRKSVEHADTPVVEQHSDAAPESGVANQVEETGTGKKEEETEFVPYLRAGTADLNTTIALALISVTMIQVMGFSYLGLGYLQKYLNFSSPIMFFVGILETVTEIGKILSFAFRLFGNIFAGEVLLAVIGFLVPVIVPMPFYGLEIFVGFIQAFVFALLTTVFFSVAAAGHEGEH